MQRWWGGGKKIGRAERRPLLSPEEPRMRLGDLGESLHRRTSSSRLAAEPLGGKCEHTFGQQTERFFFSFYFFFFAYVNLERRHFRADGYRRGSVDSFAASCFLTTSGRLVIDSMKRNETRN